MSIPEQPHLPDLPFDDALSVEMRGALVRGMDHYELFGFHRDAVDASRRYASRAVSKEAERSFLFHERSVPLPQAPDGPDPTSNCPTLDARVAERFRIPLWERAYRLTGRILINPKRRRLTVNGRVFQPGSREYPVPYQNLYRQMLDWTRAGVGRMRSVDTAIWLHHPYAHVYFHNFNDLMTQLVLADELGVGAGIPVIVDEGWADSGIGRQFLQTAFFRNREVITIARGEMLRCRTLYMFQPHSFSRARIDSVTAAFEEQQPAVPVGDHLVIIRESGTTIDRPCEGIEKLTQALVAKGYSALDPATLSIPEQKWVFSRARHIVAENGSALTNIYFRTGQDLRIDALVPSTFPSVTFQCVSRVYGFRYHAHVLPSRRDGQQFRAQLTDEVMERILLNAPTLPAVS